MPNKQYDVLIQGPAGVVKKTMAADSLQTIVRQLDQVGMKPLKVRESVPEARTTTATTTPGAGTDLASMASQAALGAAGGAAGGLPGALFGGLVGGLGPLVAARGGQFPTGREALGVAAGEIPVERAVRAGGRVLAPGLTRAAEGMVERGVERGGGMLGRLMNPMRDPAQQALEASGAIRETMGRAVGGIERQPTAIATEILTRANRMMRGATEQRTTTSMAKDVAREAATTADITRASEDVGMAGTRTTEEAQRTARIGEQTTGTSVKRIEPTMQQAMKEDFEKGAGMDLTKMSSSEFLDLIAKSPEKAAASIQAFESAAGQPLMEPGQMRKLWVGQTLQGGSRVREGARGARGLLIDPGGAYLLNGDLVSHAWKGLTPEGRVVMGPDFAQAMDGLVTKLETLPKATRGGTRIIEKGAIPMTAPIAAFMKHVNSLPVSLQAGLGAGGVGLAGFTAAHGMQMGSRLMESAAEHPMAFGAGAATAAGVGAYKLGKKGVRDFTNRVLSSTEGLRWLTSGVDQMGRGLPSVMVAEAMARTLRRSPQLLASLGLPAAPEQALPGQQAAFAMPGMPPGMSAPMPGRP